MIPCKWLNDGFDIALHPHLQNLLYGPRPNSHYFQKFAMLLPHHVLDLHCLILAVVEIVSGHFDVVQCLVYIPMYACQFLSNCFVFLIYQLFTFIIWQIISIAWLNWVCPFDNTPIVIAGHHSLPRYDIPQRRALTILIIYRIVLWYIGILPFKIHIW